MVQIKIADEAQVVSDGENVGMLVPGTIVMEVPDDDGNVHSTVMSPSGARALSRLLYAAAAEGRKVERRWNKEHQGDGSPISR